MSGSLQSAGAGIGEEMAADSKPDDRVDAHPAIVCAMQIDTYVHSGIKEMEGENTCGAKSSGDDVFRPVII